MMGGIGCSYRLVLKVLKLLYSFQNVHMVDILAKMTASKCLVL